MLWVQIGNNSNNTFSDELKDVRAYQSSSALAIEVEIDTFYATIVTATDISSLFTTRNEVYVYGNAAKTELIGKFYISEHTHPKDNEYTFTAVSIIGVYADTEFADHVWLYSENKSAGDIADEIFGSGAITFSPVGLASTAISGYIPAGTKRTALQSLAFALGARVVTAGRSDVLITTADSGSESLGTDRIYEVGASLAYEKPVTKVQVVFWNTVQIAQLYQNFYDISVQIGSNYYGIVKLGVSEAENDEAIDEPDNVVVIDNQYLIASSAQGTNIANRAIAYYQYNSRLVMQVTGDVEVGTSLGVFGLSTDALMGTVTSATRKFGKQLNATEVSARVRTAGGIVYITIQQQAYGTIIGTFTVSVLEDAYYAIPLQPLIVGGQEYQPVNYYVEGIATQDTTVTEQYKLYVARPTIAQQNEMINVTSETSAVHTNNWYIDGTLYVNLASGTGLNMASAALESRMPAREAAYRIVVRSKVTIDQSTDELSAASNAIDVHRYSVTYDVDSGVTAPTKTVISSNEKTTLLFSGAANKGVSVTVGGAAFTSFLWIQTADPNIYALSTLTPVTGNMVISVKAALVAKYLITSDNKYFVDAADKKVIVKG